MVTASSQHHTRPDRLPGDGFHSIVVGDPLTGKTSRLVQAFAAYVQDGGLTPEDILCLSFFDTNADAIRRALRPHIGEFFPWVTTLQRFQSFLLRDYAAGIGLPARVREISAASRSLVLRRAWAEVAGPLWRKFGERPGAIRELTRVIDWISANRTRFAVAGGELGDHELARTYARYIALCAEHRLLTFQEASLRCLDLLADEVIAAEVRARFPAVLVDDLHQARPDQIALIDRLRGPTTRFIGTAWLGPDEPADPQLAHVHETILNWGPAEILQSPAPGINPTISNLVCRLNGTAPRTEPVNGRTAALFTAFTVEDEMNAAAQAIVRALMDDETLQPSDVIVVAASSRLLAFAQRVLGSYGLPIAPPEALARHTPLVRCGILALRWRLLGPDLETERDLLSLPYTQVDPLDLDALCQAASARDKSILQLAPEELPELSSATVLTLARVRDCLANLPDGDPESRVCYAAVTGLGGLAWAWENSDFSRSQRDAWSRAFADWLASVRELEEASKRIGGRPDDFLELVEGQADQPVAPVGNENAIRLIDSTQANGVHGRLAFVVGLSENGVPVIQPEMQLVGEAGLAGLFAGGRRVVRPAAREQAAWIERETRRLAVMISRGQEQLTISYSRYTPAGEAQLPSPFFERLLGGDGEIDKDGNLPVARHSLWEHDERPSKAPSPEGLLPSLEVAVPQLRVDDAGAGVLEEHVFSASQIKMYLTCPLQFFYGKVLGIEAETTSKLDRGALIHEVLCAVVGTGELKSVNLQERPRPVWMNYADRLAERALVALEAAWTGEAGDLPGGGHCVPSKVWGLRFGPTLQRQAVRRWAEDVLGNWAEFEVNGLANRASRRPVLLEAPFNMELGGYRIVGRIDRIDEVRTPAGVDYEIIDYKTGSSGTVSVPAQVEKFLPQDGDSPTDYQLPIYALALMSGVEGIQSMPTALSLVNLESLEKKLRGGYVAGARRTAQMVSSGTMDYKNGLVPQSALTNEVTQGLVTTLAAMSASPYPAQPEFHCKWCAFRAACERGRAEVGAEA